MNDSRLPRELRSDALIRATTARPIDATNANRESSDAPARRPARFSPTPPFAITHVQPVRMCGRASNSFEF
jgi:hypothetical protein